MNPISILAMVDIARWRPVVYADTPRTLLRFKKFIESNKRTDQRKVVAFVFGASYLTDALQHKDRFNSVLLFDDMQNLHVTSKQLTGFDIVDVHDGHPKHLSPAEVMEVISRPTHWPDTLLSQVTRSLAQRKPSVLETTHRMPKSQPIVESGAQRMMTMLKSGLSNEDPEFIVVIDIYVKYLFRIISRSQVTKDVTKKLSIDAKELWKQALDFADSDVGMTMAQAYRDLCQATDPDLRASHVVSSRGIKAYGGDFLYFTSILPPHKTCEFLSDALPVDDKEVKPLVQVVRVPEPKAKANKAKPKASRRKT